MYAVELQQINHHYGTTPVLQDLSLQLEPGEVLGLFGHNGAGKTTSIKLILGLLQPSGGQVRVLGHPPRHPDVHRQLGYLPENVMFYPQLTGRETLQHFARLKGASRQQTKELLQRVELEAAADRKVKTYSKGMRQRLGLAQALLGKPKLLLLDEPTVGLDPIATQTLYSLIDELRDSGTCVILCSHVLPGVEPHISRAAILNHGRLQALGTVAQLREQAGLPIRIRCDGLQERQLWQQRFQQRGDQALVINGKTLEIETRPDNKLRILQELINAGDIVDLDIRQPGLEELYRHFIHQPDGTRQREATA